MTTSRSAANSAMTTDANLLNKQQWWKVCFMHGDQTKFYRDLYGRNSQIGPNPIKAAQNFGRIGSAGQLCQIAQADIEEG